MNLDDLMPDDSLRPDDALREDLLREDDANRKRALALESFIIEAPAGAGKTELLTQRYLKLLSVVDEPEEIVAITFTNKAAAEMRSRILNSLESAARGEIPDRAHKRVTYDLALPALARAEQLGWNLLAQPARLRINTIDSLSSYLARQMPLMSRFGAQPGVSADASLHYREAARRALAMLQDEADVGESGAGPVTTALRYLDNDVMRLTNLLAEMLARRDQWLHHAGQHSPQEEGEAALHHLVQQDIEQAAAVLNTGLQSRLMPVARYAASNLPCDHPVALLLDWETPIPAKPEALPMWRGVCELLLTKAGELRKEKGVNIKNGFPANDASKPYKQALAEIIAAITTAQPLAHLDKLPDVRHDEDNWQIVGALAQLLRLAAAHLWTVFQEAGEVDFVEVAHRAKQALEDETGPTDLALRLDYRIQHLLVDEFQDTSPTQVDLLRRLIQGWETGDGRTLFCVGDPMQSIYRFRKADVGLFLQAARYGIGQLTLERLKLTRNNRSSPQVVKWVNAAFQQVFPQQDSETRGAISYRRFAATREAMAAEGVVVHPLVVEREASSNDIALLEACHVADLIEQERALDHPGQPPRKIAVLVRARSHLHALVAEIRRHRPHMKFQAVEIETLAGRQAVQDILALTRALHHRADRVHWLAVLRAPWCGLTLADMHVLAAEDHYATIWHLMQDDTRLARMSEDGRQRLLHVRGILAEAYAHQGRQSTRRWVESVWLQLGGPHCLWDAGDVRDIQAFFDLVEKIDAAGSFDPVKLELAMAELYAEPDVQADDSLQFMTIHKSKGLEFDTVILPGLHRAPRNKDAPLLLWEEVLVEGAGSQLVAAPWRPKHKRDGLPSVYDYLQGLEQERGANEAARLLYVAATRAERRLHLVGAIKPDSKGERKAPGNTFLELLWHSVGHAYLSAEPMPQAVISDAVDEATFIPQLMRLPKPTVPELLNVASSNAQELSHHDNETEATAAGSLAASCGTLAHLYLEMMASSGIESWSSERFSSLQPAMKHWLQQQGHNDDEASEGTRRVLTALQITLQSSDGQWILRSRELAASELALASVSGRHITHHVVDRTFVENGTRWVIDYKSARLEEGVAELALQQQAERYRPQLERYAALFKNEGLPIRKAVFFLALGKLSELS
jgi:ATP-dependent helicase/nuclease subunit A